jgi:hypothetical protein
MDNALVSQLILSGILAGNDTLERWTGGEWVCDRGSSEYLLVSGVADHFLAGMPGWHVWPETKTGVDFKHVDTNYRDHVNDCPPRHVFGGVRYDLGLLRSPRTISGLIEIKRHWITDDLNKLARALFYLGIKPQRVQNTVEEGVSLESVFFGAFIWQNPKAKDDNVLPVEERYHKIQSEIQTWWQGARTGGGAPIQREFENKYRCPPPQPKISYKSKVGSGSKGQWEAGTVCVCLSLDEKP